MKSSIVAKLEALYERHEEVQALLGDAATIADQDKFRALSREYAPTERCGALLYRLASGAGGY
ncbi:hypothetical protein LNP24_08405 [Klebsiella pneumoniae subsp. pneumoniae]|nr:hypothetical protein [Klebsiella pneumoniae subsp. pneumoniae]